MVKPKLSLSLVILANAGIQKTQGKLDSRCCGNDRRGGTKMKIIDKDCPTCYRAGSRTLSTSTKKGRYGMKKKKKMSTEEILALSLESFDIRPLTLWVGRPEREWQEALRESTQSFKLRHVETDPMVSEIHERCRERRKNQPKTVGDLVKKYPYRFSTKAMSRPGEVGLGKEPIKELKEKLVKLGLTPDDWPALVPHSDLLKHLSKTSILKVPVEEIMTEGRRNYLHYYLGCEEGRIPSKTVRDLIQIDPLNHGRVNNISWLDCAGLFVKSHERLFVSLRQQLVKKGFSEKDGAFFNWNPEQASLNKAHGVLKKYKLAPADVRRFAKIAVAERWVV